MERETELARLLLELVRAAVPSDLYPRITCLRVRLGIGRAAPERFRQAFDRLKRGTLPEGVQLELELVPMTFRCTLCRHTFRSSEALGECPRCGALGGEVLSGWEFALLHVQTEAAEDIALNPSSPNTTPAR